MFQILSSSNCLMHQTFDFEEYLTAGMLAHSVHTNTLYNYFGANTLHFLFGYYLNSLIASKWHSAPPWCNNSRTQIRSITYVSSYFRLLIEKEISIQMEIPETNPFFSKSTCFVKSLHQWWTGPIHIRSFHMILIIYENFLLLLKSFLNVRFW
mgnify:CR=1 FL=1